MKLITTRSVFALPVLVCAALSLNACTAYTPPAHRMYSQEFVRAGGSHTIKRGENLYAVAQRYGVRVHQIVSLNKMRPPYYLRPGEKIKIPSKAPIAAPLAPLQASPIPYDGPDKYAAPLSNDFAPVEMQPLDPVQPISLTTPRLTSEEPLPLVVRDAIKPSIEIYDPPVLKKIPVPKTSTYGVPSFGWPVRGTIISTYGPKGKGRDNDGINITAPKGSPIKAAEAGEVVYAGNGMKGFGNLVLIKHYSKGWVTAYAHMERITVKKNDPVGKGDMIGTVGATGGVSSSQLHFEARRDGIPVDPELVIK